MQCIRCQNNGAFLESDVRIFCVSKWETHEGGGRYHTSRHYDNAAFWRIALCSDCALQAAKEGFEKNRERSLSYLMLFPLIVLAIVTVAVISLFGLLTGVIICAFVALLSLIRMFRAARTAVNAAQRLRNLKQGRFEWSQEDREVALLAEALRIIDVERHPKGKQPHRFTLPKARMYPPSHSYFFAKESKRKEFTYEVNLVQERGIVRVAESILAKAKGSIESLTEQDIEKLEQLVFPISGPDRVPQEMAVVECLLSLVRKFSLKDERTRRAILALGNSGATEAVPTLIELLEQEEYDFDAKWSASRALARLTDRKWMNDNEGIRPGESEAEGFNRIFSESAARYRQWWEQNS